MKFRTEPRPRRGWVYMADLNPPRGTEPGKVRPVVALQTDQLAVKHPSTIVAPLTTNVVAHARLLRVHLKSGEANLSADCDVMVDQLRAIDNRRLRRALGAVPVRRLQEIEASIAVLLDLPGA